jgi:hypothetical protein
MALPDQARTRTAYTIAERIAVQIAPAPPRRVTVHALTDPTFDLARSLPA